MNAVYKAWSILLNAWPQQSDIQRKSSKCKYCCTGSITLYLCRQRIIWKPVLKWNSINLCYNKGQRLWVSSTQPKLRALIDVSLHSTSAWKEEPSEIARSSNLFCVINCPKKYWAPMKWCFSDRYKVALLSADRFWEEGALWLAESVWVEGRAVSHYSFYLGDEEASGWWWKQPQVVWYTLFYSNYFSLHHPSFHVKYLVLFFLKPMS